MQTGYLKKKFIEDVLIYLANTLFKSANKLKNNYLAKTREINL